MDKEHIPEFEAGDGTFGPDLFNSECVIFYICPSGNYRN